MTMPSPTRLRKRLTIVAALLTVAALAASSVAIAGPKKGTYSGTIKQNNLGISFTVTKGGKKVKKIAMSDFPIFCQGGGPPAIIKFSKSAKIKNKKFKATGTEAAQRTGKVFATAKLTGKFIGSKKEKGTLKVTYSKAHSCSGTTTYKTQRMG